MTPNIADDGDQALIKLSDYPLLAALASKQTTAIRLDGRACRHLYAKASLLPLADRHGVQKTVVLLTLSKCRFRPVFCSNVCQLTRQSINLVLSR
jgi:hypothetical protein